MSDTLKNFQEKNALVTKVLENIKLKDGGQEITAMDLAKSLFTQYDKMKSLFSQITWKSLPEEDISSDGSIDEDEDFALASGYDDEIAKFREKNDIKGLEEYLAKVRSGTTWIALVGAGPIVQNKMTYCAKSARTFAEEMFGVQLPRAESAYLVEKTKYSPSAKMNMKQAISYQEWHKWVIFHAFTDRPKDAGKEKPLGHACLAYIDKTGIMMVYDPYFQVEPGKPRGMTFEASKHPRFASMRFYPVPLDEQRVSMQAKSALGIDRSNYGNKLDLNDTTGTKPQTLSA